MRAEALSSLEAHRYSRQLVLPEVGAQGQRKLKASRVAVVGTGGLGSPAALYLAAAGVGTIGVIDFDSVDLSNLQRQILHSTGSVGRPKVDSARSRIEELNPEVQVETHGERLSSDNALEILGRYDVVVDGSDNFPSRYLVNDACVLLGKPNVYGSVFRFEGQASVFAVPGGPCYRCLYAEPPAPGTVPDCAEGGVLGVLPGIIGVVQATETLKLILGVGETLAGRLLLFDALEMEFHSLRIEQDPGCPVCGENRSIDKLVDYERFCGTTTENQDRMNTAFGIEPEELKHKLDNKEPLFLLDVREQSEWQICRIEGAHLIPLGQLPGSLGQLNAADNIVVYCRSGMRSASAVNFLRQSGFPAARNLNGGILAWADRVDPTLPRY